MLENKYFLKNKIDINFFLFFVLISFLVYLPAFKSRWVFDAADFLLKYEKYGINGIWFSFYESTNTFLVSNHFIHFFIYKLFGKSVFFHSFFSIIWHSFNGFLLLKLSQNLFENQKLFFYFSVGILYITSPYHSEAVIWGCNYHYLALNSCILALLLLFYKNNNHFSLRKIVCIVLIFTFSLGLHELAFLNFIILFIFQFLFTDIRNFKNWLPIILFIPIVFIFLYLRLKVGGDSIGHYGASVHLKYNLIESIQKLNKYFYKLFLVSSVHPFQLLVHKVLDKFVVINFTILFIISAIFLRYIYNKITLFLVLGLIIYLLPVLNLYFVDYLYIAGDRYCTLPLIFSSLISAFLIFKFIKSQKVKIVFITLLILLQASTLFYYNLLWKNSNEIMENMEKYRFENNTNYYWLNLPESFKGAYMYKGGDGMHPFLVRLKLKNFKMNTNFYSIAGMNLNSNKDKIIVEKLNSKVFKVTLSQWGNWFWVGEYGASDYKNELYRVDFDDINHSYLLTFNQNNKLSKSKIIYYDSGKLKQMSLK